MFLHATLLYLRHGLDCQKYALLVDPMVVPVTRI